MIGFAENCLYSSINSNVCSYMIVFEVDPLSLDFTGFVIACFFIDPPAVGFVFPVDEAQVIAMQGAGQKSDCHKNQGNCCCDDATFGNERSHDWTNPLYIHFWISFYCRPFYRKLDLFFRDTGFRLRNCFNHSVVLILNRLDPAAIKGNRIWMSILFFAGVARSYDCPLYEICSFS